MDGRRLTVAILLIVAVTVAFATAPALGEHPWNSDCPVSDGPSTGDASISAVTYDTITVPSTTVVSGTLVSSADGMSVWIVILIIVWPTSWAW